MQVNAYRFLLLINFLEKIKYSSLIDIGCFPFTLFKLLHNMNVVGERELFGAGLLINEEHKSLFPYVKFFKANLDPDIYFNDYFIVPQNIDLPDNSIDVVIATEIFEHLYNPFHLIREMYRLVRKDGHCYMTTNNISELRGLFRLIRGETNMETELDVTTAQFGPKHDWRGHVRFYSKRTIEEMFYRVGFRKVTVNYFIEEPWFKTKYSNTPKNIVQILLNRVSSRYCSHLECVAVK